VVIALAAMVASTGSGQQPNMDVLRIGNSGSLKAVGANEQETLKSLQSFIRDETGFNNEIIRQKDWQELSEKLAHKELHLGAYQGFEFAWAQQKDPQLKPLALAVDVYVYPVIYVVARKDSPFNNFSGLEGRTLALPQTDQAYLRLFLIKLTQGTGKLLESFFS